MSIYKNPSYSIEERTQDLLSQMTLDEKIAQMHAQWLILDPQGDHQEREMEFTGDAVRADIKSRLQFGLGQITRPLGTHSVDAKAGVEALNALQHFLVEETRLGIPAMSHEECLVGLMAQGATLFPSSLNYGHTWNPALIEQAGQAIGQEIRQAGAHQGLSPVLDVSRDVRWGRTEEVLGEDPYHAGVLATRYVQGLQGKDRDVLATLKHYVGHSFSEGARNHAPVHLGFKELNDTFMLPFEMAVKLGNAGSVMPAYHDIDNEPCHASHFLLTTVLREQWGFDGLIVADYGGVDLLASHHAVAADRAEAAALAFNAGLDIELPDDLCARSVKEAVNRNLLSEAKIDEIVSRILSVKFALGLFENPYTDVAAIRLQQDSVKAVAYQVAVQSVVMTENKGILPLSQKQSVAVIGPTADDQLALLGGYSFPVHLILSSVEGETKVAKTLKQAITERLNVSGYAKGCDILTKRHAGAPVFPGDVDLALGQMQESPVSTDRSQIAEAVAEAEKAEVAVVCVGDLAGLFQTGTVGEGSDAAKLDLPGVQQALVEAVINTGTPTVVLITGGRPYNLNGWESKAAAVLYGWAPGQEGADAIGDILSGAVSPSGRLTLSIPKNVGAVPYYYNHKLKSGGTPIPYHFGSKYNFGYGLTYTGFGYRNLQLQTQEVDISGEITLSVDVVNTGQRDGCEVVQLYVRDKLASQVRPIRELKGFERVDIAAGETVRVYFTVPVDMLNFTNNQHQRVVEPGEFDLMIGRSSSDIVLTATVSVTGNTRVLPQDWRMLSRAQVERIG
ncbi:glycoside hydrolase family 3 N-terminal domain-containing protein [Photobacterium halotolerans]|uniref:glycoside hydrolase family 3 N-terminal domain-containing protein n=1 Tax=Photobacterium halotolerans TaxID=265726 RepID=UPI0003FAD0CF|nr:glycoside hydrolase family 3 N-terminal domain-containing protein [Photobacterium halotolerans]